MSFKACLTKLLREGKINAERARAAQETYDQIYDDLARTMDPVQAELAASERALKSLQAETLEKRRQTLLQARVQARVLKDIQGFGDGSAKAMADGARKLMDRTSVIRLKPRGEAKYSDLEARQGAIVRLAHSKMVEVLATFRRDLLGRVREPAKLDNLVRELKGEVSGDASAKELAHAFSATAEWLRTRYNAAGGRLAKLKNWGLPHNHDTLAVRKAGFEVWRAEILPRLDVASMIDETTGAPFSPQSLELALRAVYETIVTDGFVKLRPGQAGGRKLANRRLDHRFLIFKSADDWLAYHNEFGAGTPFDVMMGHIHGMARDIAALEILGPNPTATLRWLNDTVARQAALEDAAGGVTSAMDEARKSARAVNNMWAVYSGSATVPVDARLARAGAATRAFLVADQLGSAALSAISDLGFQAVTAKFNGLPVAKTLGGYLKLFRPWVTADQKLAVRAGAGAEVWAKVGGAQQRFVGEVNVPEIAARLSDGVLRASGLSLLTETGRQNFALELSGHLGDMAGKKFAELPPPTQRMLARYRLDGDVWDIIRSTPLHDPDGVAILQAADIAARGDLPGGLAEELATRMLEMVHTETKFTVPSTTLAARTALGGALPRGTFWGEVAQSVAMYKSFGLTLMYTHVARALEQKTMAGKASYAANLMIATTVMGAVAMQLKQIAAGKDPRPMDSDEFWAAAMLQGGGIGIFGDFLFSDVNRFGGSLAQTLAGPVVALGDDIRKLMLGNVMQLPGDDPTNFGRELANFLRRYTPGSSIWYARLAFNRILFDQLQQEIDPGHRDAFRRMEQRARREFEQDYWWRPGEIAPDRAPDLGNAVE
ncbi:MAG: hypothetical protein DCC73_11365 [Proteobacteria bacterium]|nr:MAG: hypothetical protein DCC73_11365 [Pseudomonadota bacterium]